MMFSKRAFRRMRECGLSVSTVKNVVNNSENLSLKALAPYYRQNFGLLPFVSFLPLKLKAFQSAQ